MNLHYLFNTEYYSELSSGGSCTKTRLDSFNTRLIESKFKPAGSANGQACLKEVPFSDKDDEYSILTLKVLYPGLLLGLGYPHGLGTDDPAKNTAIKLGFSLDYVTGLPIIPGSTVKGVLRSVFQRNDAQDYIVQTINNAKKNAKKKASIRKDNLPGLEREIFGTWCTEDEHQQGGDIFFDALPIKTSDEKLLALEYITPHTKVKNEQGPAAKLVEQGLKGPNPIRLLKVRPGVVYLFRFKLLDSGLLGKDEKLVLFENILCDFGIGAKTNVGFGAMKHIDDVEAHLYWLEQQPESDLNN
jgi:CRISPR-associated protein Cmr6